MGTVATSPRRIPLRAFLRKDDLAHTRPKATQLSNVARSTLSVGDHDHAVTRSRSLPTEASPEDRILRPSVVVVDGDEHLPTTLSFLLAYQHEDADASEQDADR